MEIDLLKHEMGKRHWLHPLEQYKHIIAEERERFLRENTKDAYDPAEKRDPHGRWTKGAGGGASSKPKSGGTGTTNKNPVAKEPTQSPLGPAHNEAAKHMQSMGHAIHNIKIANSLPDVTFNEQRYQRIGEVNPKTGASLYTNAAKTSQVAEQRLRGTMSKNEDSTPSQPVKSLDDLYTRSKADEMNFLQMVKDCAATVGGKAEFTPPEFAEPGTTMKKRSSAQRKMVDEYDNDPTKLLDILRGTVACETVKDVRTAAINFIEKHRDRIVRIKDRIVKPAQGGYRDIMLNFRTDSGIIAELQFNTPTMINVKLGEGHKIYEELRNLKAKHDGKMHQKMIEFLERQSEKVYGEAYDKGGDGNWA